MPNIAVIDLGTNAFNLFIVSLNKNRFDYEVIHSSKQSVKLGEGGISDNIIKESAIERALETLVDFKKTCEANHVGKIIAMGTSAIRNAKNKDEFCKNILDKTGIKVSVLNGKREAELIYKGVRDGVALSYTDNSLIMDIGGGSIEFIICNKDGVIWKHSFDIGIARLLDKYKPSDVIETKEIALINNYLNRELILLKTALTCYPVSELIGCSGSFDTFSDILMFEDNINPNENKFNSYKYDLSKLKNLFKKLYKSNSNTRAQMPGMISMRVEMIVMAAICTEFIINTFNIKSVKHATFSLKEGVVSELIQKL